MDRIEQLKKRDALHGVDTTTFLSSRTAKRAKLQDVINALKPVDMSDDSSDDEDDPVVDWRAKKT